MTEERPIELIDTPRAIRIAGGIHLPQHEWMAAHRALAEDDEIAREQVRALDGDRDRHGLVAAGEVVVRAEADALPAMHVHRIADGTDGFSPPSIAPAVTERAASIVYVSPTIRASTASTPSNRPTGMLNCR